MRLVGRYQLIERIGEGAMAEVWRAHDPSIDRVLAIKILKGEFRRNEEYAARFLREAKAAGALAHPAIVTIYDVGTADGYPYIAMELLDGDPLDRVLAHEGKLPPELVLGIAGQLASALSYAHLSGVVHRDIKPSNIMLCRDGRSIKLLDFGIARVTEEGAASEDEQVRTQIGQVVGTPRYMSPEQAMARDVDGRSDLFSVGAVLYEMITGHPARARRRWRCRSPSRTPPRSRRLSPAAPAACGSSSKSCSPSGRSAASRTAPTSGVRSSARTRPSRRCRRTRRAATATCPCRSVSPSPWWR
jgi:eukaryotic-like serine/threonine-protein kinase